MSTISCCGAKNPLKRAKAIVEATTHCNDPEVLARVSKGLGTPMSGTAVSELTKEKMISTRGW